MYTLLASKPLTAVEQGLHTHYINCMKMMVIKDMFSTPVLKRCSAPI